MLPSPLSLLKLPILRKKSASVICPTHISTAHNNLPPGLTKGEPLQVYKCFSPQLFPRVSSRHYSRQGIDLIFYLFRRLVSRQGREKMAARNLDSKRTWFSKPPFYLCLDNRPNRANGSARICNWTKEEECLDRWGVLITC